MIYISNNEGLMEKIQVEMTQEFEMRDLVQMHYFLDMQVEQQLEGIFISQAKYVVDLLEKFDMKACKAVTTPLVLG